MTDPRLESLEEQFRTHKHSGLDSQRVNIDDLVGSEARPYSFPLTANVGDTTTYLTTDNIDHLITFENASHFLLMLGGSTIPMQRRDVSSDWAAIDNIWGGVIKGNYVYILMQDTGASPDEWQIWRYNINDLSAGGTICTFSGTAPDLTVDSNLRIASDFTHIYLNYNGGNSANAYVLAKYAVSGTVLTYLNSVTCGSATLGFNQNFIVRRDGSVYTINTTDRNISKFDSSGTLVYTDDASTLTTTHEKFSNIEDTLYCYNSSSKQFERMFYN